MRILHVVPYYEQAWAYGGIPRLATTMTRALARQGHGLTVCTTDARDERSRAAPVDNAHGVDVRMFRNVSNSLAYHLQFFTPVGLRGYMRHAAKSFDVAHIHACHNLPGVIAASELSRAAVPYIVSPNGTALPIERRITAKRLFARTAGRSFLSGAARIVAVSQAEVRQLRALGIAESTVVHIPNPIDDRECDPPADPGSFRRRLALSGDAPFVLFLGKLTPRKGVGDLVRAFARVGRSDAVLVVAGNDMGARGAVETVVRQLELKHRVIFTGLLSGRTRFDALAAATVVVYPSRDEIFGLVPLESLLCGTPVVVCDDSGCGELISSTGGGQTVPYADVGRLALAIEDVLADQHSWRSRARAAAIIVRRRFGADEIGRQLDSLYRSVVDHVSTPCRIGL